MPRAAAVIVSFGLLVIPWSAYRAAIRVLIRSSSTSPMRLVGRGNYEGGNSSPSSVMWHSAIE